MRHTSRWISAILLSLVPWLMVLGNSVLIPGLPEMANRMQVTRLQVSLLITLFSLPAGVIIPFAGMLSDRFGRKAVIIPSLLVFGAGGLVAGLACGFLPRPYPFVLAGRVIQGLGAAGTAPIAMALVGDLFQGAERARVLGIHEAGNAFGKVVSPVVGAAVGLLAWFAAFFVFPVLCLPLAAAIWWRVPSRGGEPDARRTESGAEERSYFGNLLQVFPREGRWLSIACACGATALFTLFGMLFYLSDLLEKQYGLDGLKKGFILAIPLGVLTLTSVAAGIAIRRRRRRMKWMLVGGLCGMAASLMACGWLAPRAGTLVALLSLSALGTGCVLPSLNMLITSAVSSALRGVVTSFYGSVRFLGVAAGPPAITSLMNLPRLWMFSAVAALCILCAGLAVWLIRPEETSPGGGADNPRLLSRRGSSLRPTANA
ncbi:MFS transporter [Alicyclobacillus macrosporangiidus]|uniref:MFS transporter, ACDE family, multidrug resistance protein n=1 Tax=Alicyclobacillus macrosporangiidus TaxID=392015 RepID=A0A1I7L7T2_9BACL|nr:MFS transporter [Alicyclobacillus macrosporangiidus]SFV05544.1 MFS transporter, ACDE family, multidrug resistance protein [Alicyclobacillus macrosporangiidus]